MDTTVIVSIIVGIFLLSLLGIGLFIWIKRKDTTVEESPSPGPSGPSGPSGPGPSVVTPGPSGPSGPSGFTPGPSFQPSPSTVTGTQPAPSSSFRYTQTSPVGRCNAVRLTSAISGSNYILQPTGGSFSFTETYLQVDNSDIFKINSFTASTGLYFGNFVDGSNQIKLPSAFPTKYNNANTVYLCNAGIYRI